MCVLWLQPSCKWPFLMTPPKQAPFTLAYPCLFCLISPKLITRVQAPPSSSWQLTTDFCSCQQLSHVCNFVGAEGRADSICTWQSSGTWGDFSIRATGATAWHARAVCRRTPEPTRRPPGCTVESHRPTINQPPHTTLYTPALYIISTCGPVRVAF